MFLKDLLKIKGVQNLHRQTVDCFFSVEALPEIPVFY